MTADPPDSDPGSDSGSGARPGPGPGGRSANRPGDGWSSAAGGGRSGAAGRGDAGGAGVRGRVGRRRRRREAEQDLDASMHLIKLPESLESPSRQVGRRCLVALAVLVVTALLVYADRFGYNDNALGHPDLLASFYYATVTLSTTGYGDITPVSATARLVNILVVTPLRVLFLLILVGTTLEVLTTRTRHLWRVGHWRASLDQHVVIIGYGTKGRNAMETLVTKGVPRDRIVVVDQTPKAIAVANSDGLATVLGDGTRTEVLRRAELGRAAHIIVAPNRDDTAALTTLTVRQLNQGAVVVAAVRDEENGPLLRQSGASVVVTSSGSAGRMLGLSAISPNAGVVLDDLLTVGNGLDVIDRPVTRDEVGGTPRDVAEDLVVAVVRGNRRLAYNDPEAQRLQAFDRLIAIRRTNPQIPL